MTAGIAAALPETISVPLPFDHSTDETLSGALAVGIVSASSLGGLKEVVCLSGWLT